MHLKFITIAAIFVGLASCQTTNFVDKDSKLEGYAEPQWFKENIPFVEIPDKEIEEVYYYRWSSHKRHLQYSAQGVGYTVTEFIPNAGYGGKFDTINAAAGHHIYESRWLRNLRYAEDYINFWSREGGNNYQYTDWIADASYATYLVTGNRDFIASQQEGLVKNFNGWNGSFEPSLNLYYVTPEKDAQEYSASSMQTGDQLAGGLGYRPSFNSEMYANAIAISKIARMNNDIRTAEEFEERAEAIRRGIMEHLWDEDRKFFFHMFKENNTNHELLDTREEIGFYPWRFGVPDDNPKYDIAWASLFDRQGFNSTYGPTTCEQRSKWFDGNQTAQCCWWNGNSWPYSTGHVISSLAAQIKRYRVTDFANVDTLVEVLHKYAVTQHRDGKPYVGECHSPYRDIWVCDRANHSEHYAHSMYTNNVLGDLLGVEPQSENTFVINPLIPSSWSYFILENLLYHGHNVTVLYDAEGTKYNVGKGLFVYLNGQEIASSPRLGRLSVDIPAPVIDEEYRRKKIENYAVNENRQGYPMAEASFNSVLSNPWQAIDGRIFYDFVPSNRWTNFDSPNEKDWFSVDFGPNRTKTVDEVKVYIYSDVATNQGNVDCPKKIAVEIWTPSGNWVAAENQSSSPSTCVPNDVFTIHFNPVKTQKVRLVFTRNQEMNWFVGMTEVEIWAPWPQVEEEGVYEAEDGYIVGGNIYASFSASGGSFVGQINGADSYVEFTGVWVEESKEYEVRVYYANDVQDESTMIVTANNVKTQTAIFPHTLNGWGQFNSLTYVTLKVPLLRGNNAIIFKHGENFVELDKIKVIT